MNKFLIVANTDKDINLKLSQDIVAYKKVRRRLW